MSVGAGRPVTIGQVAAAAGVSRATVSRVLNGRTSVDPGIARKVRSAAERLQYAPNPAARSLSLGRTQTVALVVPDLGNPMFHEILHGLTAGAAKDGYRILVADTGEDPEAEMNIALEARHRCDALVLCAPRLPADQLRELVRRAAPVVVINREVPDGDVASLAIDYASAVRSLADHLTGLGHRTIVYVEGPERSVSNVARRAALDGLGPGVEVSSVPGGSALRDGYAAAEAVLASRATAAVAFNDLVAVGLLARLGEIGVAVPADLSVAGFDGIDMATYATPSLTTMSVSHATLGREAWARLRASIDGAGTDHAVFFRPQLDVRASTGPVPWRRAGVRHDGLGDPNGTESTTRAGAAADGRISEPTWNAAGEAYALHSGDLVLARYESGDRVPEVHSPRPYLHPVRTSRGVPLTEARPVDHRHHYGVSLTLPDVNGTTYWGGRTFVRDRGPELLANHGRQHSLRVQASGPALVDTLTWYDENNGPLLEERRELRAGLTPDGQDWVLSWSSRLSAEHGPLCFASPATNGRPGAGYGGVFWRLPNASLTEVFSEAGSGVENAHGARSRWLAIVQHRPSGSATLVLSEPGPEPLPWFVRAADYVGAGPAVAWDAVRAVSAGEVLTLRLRAVLLNRVIGFDEAGAVYRRLDEMFAAVEHESGEGR